MPASLALFLKNWLTPVISRYPPVQELGKRISLGRPHLNQFFKKSAKLAGITRRVSSHACRHSFASHLFESGTDIKYIQSLLGHVDPRSTDVYLHVSNKTLLGIRSPFDNPEGGES